jgi:hypothetical protein
MRDGDKDTGVTHRERERGGEEERKRGRDGERERGRQVRLNERAREG